MKESTIIASGIEMTFVKKHEADASVEITKQQMADWLKTVCNADDVHVASIKIFESEKLKDD